MGSSPLHCTAWASVKMTKMLKIIIYDPKALVTGIQEEHTYRMYLAGTGCIHKSLDQKCYQQNTSTF